MVGMSGPGTRRRAWRLLRVMAAGAASIAVLGAVAGAILWNWPWGFHAFATWAFRTLQGLTLVEVPVNGWPTPALRGGPDAPEDSVPVLMLHGYGTSKEAMTLPMSWLKGSRRVWAPDAPGFGDHDLPPGDAPGPAEYLRWIDQFRVAIGAERMDVVGTSMGGALAAAYAAEHPERVRRLVLLAPAGVEPPVRNDFMRAAYRGENPLDIRGGEDFDRVVQTVFARPPAIPAPFRQAMVDRAVARRDDWLRIVERIRPFLLDGVRAQLSAIDAPTLVIYGSADRVTDASMLSVFQRGIARTRAVIVPDAGHVVFADAPREVAAELRAFLGPAAGVGRHEGDGAPSEGPGGAPLGTRSRAGPQ